MSTTEPSGRSVKTLGIKLAPDVHAQLSFIAQLREGTITDEIQIAIAAHLARAKDDPDLRARADQVQAEIEREAAARRAAIAGLFASDTVPPEPAVSSDGESAATARSTVTATDTDQRRPSRPRRGQASSDS